jgi:hypothetical protein
MAFVSSGRLPLPVIERNLTPSGNPALIVDQRGQWAGVDGRL